MPRLHVIADGAPLAYAAFRGGAPAVQVRIKEADDDAVLAECEHIVAAAKSASAMVIVNDRADIALAAGADGPRRRQDLRVVLRRLIGPHPGGAPRHSRHRPSPTKTMAFSYVEWARLRLLPPKTVCRTSGACRVEKVAASVDIPVIAIAGITAARVPELLAAGAHGVAVIGAVAHAADPTAATAELLEALDG